MAKISGSDIRPGMGIEHDGSPAAPPSAGARGTAPDGMNVQVQLLQDRPIGSKLPETVVLEVTEAGPHSNGQTAASDEVACVRRAD